MNFSSTEVKTVINQCLAEDIGPGDYSSLSSIDPSQLAVSRILFKQNGVLAGMQLAQEIVKTVDPNIEFNALITDGAYVIAGTQVAELKGNAISLLAAERLLLNFMQRLSGIASMARLATEQIAEFPTCKILDTRKTTPGLRMFEKWAVTIGGAHNHRFGLFDMVMLKDNHVDSAGGITAAITNCISYLKEHKLDLKIEIETRNLEEVKEVLAVGGINRIMLDNFTPEQCAEAVQIIAGKYETEASGGISIENLKQYAATGIDYISLGLLTHSAKSIDISMKTKLIKQ